jgi:hypothetical protein
MTTYTFHSINACSEQGAPFCDEFTDFQWRSQDTLPAMDYGCTAHTHDRYMLALIT